VYVILLPELADFEPVKEKSDDGGFFDFLVVLAFVDEELTEYNSS
jgi:hypothetical protein